MESLQMWSQQLQDYTQQQATISEKEGKALRGIQAATRAIQDLNAKAGGAPYPMVIALNHTRWAPTAYKYVFPH